MFLLWVEMALFTLKKNTLVLISGLTEKINFLKFGKTARLKNINDVAILSYIFPVQKQTTWMVWQFLKFSSSQVFCNKYAQNASLDFEGTELEL